MKIWRLAQTDAIQTTTLPAACHFLNIGGVPTIVGGGPIPAAIASSLPTGFTTANQVILNTRPSGTVTMQGEGVGAFPTINQGGVSGLSPSGCGATSGNALVSVVGDSLTSNSKNPTLNNMTVPWIGQFPFPNENNTTVGDITRFHWF